MYDVIAGDWSVLDGPANWRRASQTPAALADDTAAASATKSSSSDDWWSYGGAGIDDVQPLTNDDAVVLA
jgi:hypothetical protein